MRSTIIIQRILIIVLLVCMCLILAGCPSPTDRKAVKNGEAFKREVDSIMYNMYGVEFSDTTEIANINYKGIDGTENTAIFKLDGFDATKMIGYKLVLNEDKAEWEQSRDAGGKNVPDLSNFESIQKNSADYKYPIIFISAYEYQDEKNEKQRVKNFGLFREELFKILDMPQLKQWSEKGLYDGEWIQERLEEICLDSYGIYFSKTDIPIVEIPYKQNEKAVFGLSGFDESRQIGYKFVTAEDEASWEMRRKEGDMNAPDLLRSKEIKEQAVLYDFPVLFVYVPEYWKTYISDIFNKELSEPLNMNEYIKQWLEEHK